MAKWSLAQPEAAEVDDVVFAVSNHLVGDLYEQTGHTLISVVVTCDCVDHLN